MIQFHRQATVLSIAFFHNFDISLNIILFFFPRPRIGTTLFLPEPLPMYCFSFPYFAVFTSFQFSCLLTDCLSTLSHILYSNWAVADVVSKFLMCSCWLCVQQLITLQKLCVYIYIYIYIYIYSQNWTETARTHTHTQNTSSSGNPTACK